MSHKKDNSGGDRSRAYASFNLGHTKDGNEAMDTAPVHHMNMLDSVQNTPHLAGANLQPMLHRGGRRGTVSSADNSAGFSSGPFGEVGDPADEPRGSPTAPHRHLMEDSLAGSHQATAFLTAAALDAAAAPRRTAHTPRPTFRDDDDEDSTHAMGGSDSGNKDQAGSPQFQGPSAVRASASTAASTAAPATVGGFDAVLKPGPTAGEGAVPPAVAFGSRSNELGEEDGTGSAHSGAGGSSSAGSGNEEDENPLFSAVLQVVRASRKGQHGGTSPAQQSDLSAGPSPTDSEMRTATQQSGSGSLRKAVQDARDARAAVSELMLALNVQSARALIIADPVNDKIVWCNEAAQRVFGRLDLVGNVLEVLMPPEIAEKHVGMVSAYVERYHRSFQKTGQEPDTRLLNLTETRHLKVVRLFNGRERTFYINAWVRTLRIPGEDRSEPSRLMALEAFDAQKYHDDAQAARVMTGALSEVSDGVVVADFEGKLEWVNSAMEKLSGYSLSMLLAQRASVNMFLDPDFIERHEGYLAHFRNSRKHAAANMEANTREVIIPGRRVTMKTSYGHESVILKVTVQWNKLVAFLRSTSEFIPRDEFENERLKLLLPAAIVKMIGCGAAGVEMTNHHWDFEHASVLFTDLPDFDSSSKNRGAKHIHTRMQPYFSGLEELITAFGGELIHRVGGGCVLAIFGLNGEERYHARYAVACAVEMQQFAFENQLRIRIGINSGPLGAGIYGSSKGRPSFDIFGGVVNAAKRMEEKGVPGCVHFSKPTMEKLGTRFSGELHNIVEKNHLSNVKGLEHEVDTYLLRVSGVIRSPSPPSGVNSPSAEATSGARTGILLSDKLLQQVGAVRAKFARWKISNEETERRLAELQRASGRAA